ncbi:MAG TPA: alcohol dehydrogenase catalytic domain-containing protein, partial [Parapedobacter sp.]|nr:alcohol dehydrogenase catalytic domain-containing protein [Parapedobacter sp.]
MDTIICHTPGVLKLIQTDEPRPHPTEALLKIRQVGICGTDLHAFKGVQPYFNYPRILGHELAAEVLAIPPGHDFEVGELVTVKPYFHCGHCIACRQGKTNCCVNMQVYGVHIDGGMRMRVSMPISALVKGNGLGLDQLSIVEPLAIGAHGVRRTDIQPGEHVLIMGAGPIGIGTLLLAQAAGAQVMIMDTDSHRLRH